MGKQPRREKATVKDMEIVSELYHIIKMRCKTDLHALKILRLTRTVILHGTEEIKVVSNENERPSGERGPVTK